MYFRNCVICCVSLRCAHFRISITMILFVPARIRIYRYDRAATSLLSYLSAFATRWVVEHYFYYSFECGRFIITRLCSYIYMRRRPRATRRGLQPLATRNKLKCFTRKRHARRRVDSTTPQHHTIPISSRCVSGARSLSFPLDFSLAVSRQVQFRSESFLERATTIRFLHARTGNSPFRELSFTLGHAEHMCGWGLGALPCRRCKRRRTTF